MRIKLVLNADSIANSVHHVRCEVCGMFQELAEMTFRLYFPLWKRLGVICNTCAASPKAEELSCVES